MAKKAESKSAPTRIWGLGSMHTVLIKIGDDVFLPAYQSKPMTKKADGSYWWEDVDYGKPFIYNAEGQGRFERAFVANVELPDPQSVHGLITTAQF